MVFRIGGGGRGRNFLQTDPFTNVKGWIQLRVWGRGGEDNANSKLLGVVIFTMKRKIVWNGGGGGGPGYSEYGWGNIFFKLIHLEIWWDGWTGRVPGNSVVLGVEKRKRMYKIWGGGVMGNQSFVGRIDC